LRRHFINGIDYWVAAVRECFEKAGFLLACNENGETVNFATKNVKDRFHEYRK